MVYSGIDAGIRLRPTEKELPSLGPEFKQFWDDVMVPNPDKPLHQLGAFAGYAMKAVLQKRVYLPIAAQVFPNTRCPGT